MRYFAYFHAEEVFATMLAIFLAPLLRHYVSPAAMTLFMPTPPSFAFFATPLYEIFRHAAASFLIENMDGIVEVTSL